MKKDYRELYEKITKSDWFKKAYHDKSLGECPIVVEELEESDDERIRKSLIKDFRNYYEMYDKSCGEPKWGSDCLLVKDILAWFEKQKEKKSVTVVRIPKFRVGDIIQHTPLEKWDRSARINSIDENGYNIDYTHIGDNVSGGYIGFSFEDEYELVEKEPAEWSDDIIQKAIKEVGLTQHQIDWLLVHHFDFHGLIEKGLALDVSHLHQQYPF